MPELLNGNAPREEVVAEEPVPQAVIDEFREDLDSYIAEFERALEEEYK